MSIKRFHHFARRGARRGSRCGVCLGVLALLSCAGHDTGGVAGPWRLQGQAMAAAADQRAVEAALSILRQGGHAVDAAIAAHAVLGLVEPQSSGIGGGAFMLVYEREQNQITAYDGRETAPAAASPDMFIDNGTVMDFVRAWQSGKAVGVPAMPALYALAHERHGRSDWAQLFAPAIALAERGFIVSPRLASLLASPKRRQAIRLDDNPKTARYFYPDGEPLKAGQTRTNPDYAHSLRLLAEQGTAPFYHGDIARKIVEAAKAEPDGGTLSLDDLAAYKILEREAICMIALRYRLCSAPPPSSGGVAQGMIMGLYERFAASDDEAKLLAFVDAQRLAYADRDHYIADPDFVRVPTSDLLHPAYLDARTDQRAAPDESPVPGDPGAILGKEPIKQLWGIDASNTGSGTTHLSIVDMYGNVVSMTATIESAFGASRMVGGFLLNNQLTDFARAAEREGKALANAPAGGKRPRSSMSPTLVFDENDDFFMATGSPGGNSIIAYVAKTLAAVLDWGMDAQTSIDYPNIIARGDTVRVETASPKGQAIAKILAGHGYRVKESAGEISGLHLIIAREHAYEGGADNRREGVALAIGR